MIAKLHKKKYLLLLSIFSFTILTAQQQAPSIIWQKCLGGAGDDQANTIIRTIDNAFLIGGSAKSNDGNVTGHHGSLDSSDAWIVKVSSTGDLLWQKSFGGTGDDNINQLIATTDGGYLGIGTTTSNNGDVSGNHGYYDIWVIKLDRQGNLLWQKCFGGSWIEEPKSAKNTIDGGYIIIGNTSSNNNGDVAGFKGGSADIWIVKISAEGNLQWQNCLGGSHSDYGYDIIQLSSGEYVLGVDTDSRDGDFPNAAGNGPIAHFLKLNAEGQIINSFQGNQRSSVYSVKQLQDGSYIVLENRLRCYPNPSGYGTAISHLSSSFSRIFGEEDVEYYHCSGSVDDLFGFATKGPDNILPLTHGNNIVSMSTDRSTTQNPTHGNVDGSLSKFNFSGTIVWEKRYGGSGFDSFNGLVGEDDYTYIACGATKSNNGDVSGNHGKSDFWIVKVGQTNLIKGVVFSDYDKNGEKDNNEPFLNNIIIQSTKDSIRAGSSSYNGMFGNSVDTGTYITSPLNAPLYYVVNPSSKTTSFTTYNNSDSVSFALQAIPGKRDYMITVLSPMPLRPGFEAAYSIQYTNAGTDTLKNKNIHFVKDKHFEFLSSDPEPFSVSGDTIMWHLNSLLPNSTGYIRVEAKAAVPPLLNINDTTMITVSIDSTNDLTPSNNYSILRQVVRGSFDPNDKQESRDGKFSSRDIENKTDLVYTIRFQNTGNDTAFNVIVKDTLDANAEWSSLEMIATSHPYKFTIANGNKLTWSFKDIFLVDSVHDEPDSHGYITYRIKPKSTLVQGDTIKNSAAIYFDFNPPVITNTQLTIIKAPSIIKPQLSHLASSYCTNSGTEKGKIDNLPVGGEMVISAKLDEEVLIIAHDSTFSFDVSNLSAGNHIINVSYSNQTAIETTTHEFSVVIPEMPIVHISSNFSTVTNATDPVIITAENVSGGGVSPLFTFAKDNNFTNVLQPQGVSNTLSIVPGSLILGPNRFYVKMKTSDSCYIRQTGIDSITIERKTGSGLRDEDYPNQIISIYPNPFKSNISITGLSTTKTYDIKINNTSGQTVYYQQINNISAFVIIKNNLPNGRYTLSIYDTKKNKLIGTKPLIK